ncbi:MAG TPA: DUF4623 domain-containing protein [Verrucomicrobiota bacterium]|nr:DUF4623 domain-containing protein [Verrucomicrobiota bacterium]HNU50891.1 DUF4623 domain-containing protein [Verrucomicrobiota bacterium]
MKTLQLLGLAAAALLPIPVTAQVQLQPLWQLDPGSRPYLPNYPGDNNQRSVAYNPTTGNIALVNRTGGLSVNILDCDTGVDRGSLKTTGISGGTYSLSQIAIAEDGAIYAANLVSSTSGANPFKIYRWAKEAWNTEPTLVYSGEVVSGTRWGDNIEIRGSGNQTQILLGQGGSGVGERIAIFTTSDNGTSFSPTVMSLSGQGFAPGDSRGGVAFGNDDTFYVKNTGGTTLYHGTFDLASSSAVLTSAATLWDPIGASGYAAIATELQGEDLLAAINFNSAPNPQSVPQNVVLFYVIDPSSPILLDVKPFIDPGIQNLNGAGAVGFGGGKLIALDTNNGLRAWNLIPEPQVYAFLSLGLGALWFTRRPQRRS